jgi:hypothetical protein
MRNEGDGRYDAMDDGSGSGRDGDRMTQKTAPKCWGMILEWVWSDGIARILMTGVILPH